jgi:hypothetical protein
VRRWQIFLTNVIEAFNQYVKSFIRGVAKTPDDANKWMQGSAVGVGQLEQQPNVLMFLLQVPVDQDREL